MFFDPIRNPDSVASEERIAAASVQTSTQVSIIVPVHNDAAQLQKLLTSLRLQTDQRLQILALDFASQDGSREILERNAAKDRRMSITDASNSSYAAAINAALKQAVGTWVGVVLPCGWLDIGMYFAMEVFYYGTREDVVGRIDVLKTPYFRVAHYEASQAQAFDCRYRGAVKPPSQPFSLAEAGAVLLEYPSLYSLLLRREFLVEQGLAMTEATTPAESNALFEHNCLTQARNILYLDTPFFYYVEADMALSGTDLAKTGLGRLKKLINNKR